MEKVEEIQDKKMPNNEIEKEYEEKEQELLEKIKKNGQDPQLFYELGYHYFQKLKNYKQAEKYFKQTIEIKQDYADAYYQLAQIQMKSKNKQYDYAEKNFNLAIFYNKEQSQYYQKLAQFYQFKKENYELAEVNFKLAIKYNQTKDYGIQFQLAKFYSIYIKDDKKAEEIYKNIISEKPDYYKPYYHLAELYYRDKDNSEFKKIITEENYFLALKYKPGHSKSYKGLANLYRFEFQKYDRAEEYYLKALQNCENEVTKAEILEYLADFYQNELNNQEKALKYYQMILDLEEDHISAYTQITYIYYSQQNYDQALKYTQLALKYDEDDSQSYYNQGLIYSQYNQKELAEKSFLKSIKLNKAYFESYYSLMYLYGNEQQYDKAQEYANLCIYYTEKDSKKHSDNEEIVQQNQGIMLDIYKYLQNVYMDTVINTKQLVNVVKQIYVLEQNEMNSYCKDQIILAYQNLQNLVLKKIDLFENDEKLNQSYKRIKTLHVGNLSTVNLLKSRKNGEKYIQKITKFNNKESFDEAYNFYFSVIQAQEECFDQKVDLYITIQQMMQQPSKQIYLITEYGNKSLYQQYNNNDFTPELAKQLIQNSLKGLLHLNNLEQHHLNLTPQNIYQVKYKYKLGNQRYFKKVYQGNEVLWELKVNSYFLPKNFKEKYLKETNNNDINNNNEDQNEQYIYLTQQQKDKEINWLLIDIYSLGLTFFAAICKIENMGKYSQDFGLIENTLDQKQQENIYKPAIFDLINKMLEAKNGEKQYISDLLKIVEQL